MILKLEITPALFAQAMHGRPALNIMVAPLKASLLQEVAASAVSMYVYIHCVCVDQIVLIFFRPRPLKRIIFELWTSHSNRAQGIVEAF